MSESKFRKMEKEIAELKKEVADLRTQVLLLAARTPQIFYTNPAPQPVYPAPHYPPYQPIWTKNENVYDDGHEIMCEAISRTGN